MMTSRSGTKINMPEVSGVSPMNTATIPSPPGSFSAISPLGLVATMPTAQ